MSEGPRSFLGPFGEDQSSPSPQIQVFGMVVGTDTTIRPSWSFPARAVIIDNATSQYLYVASAQRFVPPYTYDFTIRLVGESAAVVSFQPPPGIAQPAPVNGQAAIVQFTEEPIPPTAGTTVAIAQVTVATIQNLSLPSTIKRAGFNLTLAGGGGSAVVVGTGLTGKIWQILFSTDVVQAGADPRLNFYDGLDTAPNQLVVHDTGKVAADVVVPCFGSPIIQAGFNLGAINHSGGQIITRGSVFYEL